MLKFAFFFKMSLTSVVAGITRRPIIVNDTLDSEFGNAWQYLDYEEPQFNYDEGLTTDFFTDDYVGFYTKPNRALSFGWELTNEGEVPWAGMVVGYHKVRQGCGAILLTEEHVMTPCACVRTYVYKSAGKKDHEYALDNKALFYESDQGEDIYVVIDSVQFRLDLLEAKNYPKITGVVGADLCFEAWDIRQHPNAYEHYMGYYEPAILKFSPAESSGVDLPWPPSPISYDHGPFKDPNIQDYEFYAMKNNVSLGAQYVSFHFKPFENNVKSWDNFNREIQFEDRQVELYVKLCSQTNCASIKEFGILRKYIRAEQLKTLLCWCDDPEPPEELMFQDWKEAKVPHFLQSVYGGLAGSPIIHKGGLIGWEMNLVEYGKRSGGQRSSLSRSVDSRLISYVDWKVPALAKGNRPNVHDRNRPKFAIHDQKLFLPDPDLTEEDVDLFAWSLEGESLRNILFSGKDSISPRLKSLIGISSVLYLIAHYFHV